MAGTSRAARVVMTGLMLTLAGGAVAASAEDLASSPPALHRATTDSALLQEKHAADGRGVTVAVIDTGVADVAGLDGRVIHQENFSAAPAEGDQYGHGTFVAGLVHSTAPAADIVSIKLSGANGSVDVTQVLAALQWVSANRERFSIDVVNLSFGNDSKQSAYTSPLNFGVQRLWDQGIVVVASAGNLGDGAGTVTKPGDDPVIISVGGSDERGTTTRDNDFVPGYVSRGPTQDGLAKPDLVAPGSRIVSLRAPGSTADVQHPEARVGDTHFRGTGTSFAAPIVSGIVAQMLSANPSLTPDQVKHGLLAGATTIEGDATALGAGTVRARRALEYAAGGKEKLGGRRSDGSGSLEGSRGSGVVDVETLVKGVDGTVGTVTVRVEGAHTAEVVSDPLDAPLLAQDAVDGFLQDEYLDPASWDASSWGASQWGASSWGASSWGASSWGASSWGSSQWWASQWG